MWIEILNPDVMENSMKETAELKSLLQYGEGMSLRVMPPSQPLPRVPFSCGFLGHHLRKAGES